MKKFKSEQTIGQLEKRKGGYFFLTIDSETVNQFENKRHSRLICNLEIIISMWLESFRRRKFFHNFIN
jgi:hypothetical protein